MRRQRWILMLISCLFISGCVANHAFHSRAQDLYEKIVLRATTQAYSEANDFYRDRPTARQEAIAIIDQWQNAARRVVDIYDDGLHRASNNRVRQMYEDQMSNTLIKTFSELNSSYRGKLKDKARAEAVIMLDEWENEPYKTKDPERFNALVEQLAKRMTGQSYWSYQEAAEIKIRFRNSISQ